MRRASRSPHFYHPKSSPEQGRTGHKKERSASRTSALSQTGSERLSPRCGAVGCRQGWRGPGVNAGETAGANCGIQKNGVAGGGVADSGGGFGFGAPGRWWRGSQDRSTLTANCSPSHEEGRGAPSLVALPLPANPLGNPHSELRLIAHRLSGGDLFCRNDLLGTQSNRDGRLVGRVPLLDGRRQRLGEFGGKRGHRRENGAIAGYPPPLL